MELAQVLPTLNAADSTFNGGSHPNAPGSGDAWAAKFVLVSGPAVGDFTFESFGDPTIGGSGPDISRGNRWRLEGPLEG